MADQTAPSRTVRELYRVACHSAGADARRAARDALDRCAKAQSITTAELLEQNLLLDLRDRSRSQPATRSGAPA